jgi:radical SAM-linked protein
MVRTRVRIRFRKEHDLRLLGHQDLLRAWERWLRRADVRPAQTEGFHKRPRMNYPSALAVGICGLDEVVELELEQDREPDSIAAALTAHAPVGLSIVSIERMPAGARFSQPAAAEYEIRLPDDALASTGARIESLRRTEESAHEQTAQGPASHDATQESTSLTAPSPESAATCAAAPSDVAATADEPLPDSERLPASVQALELVDGVLRMRLKLGEAKAVRPRELLTSLGLSDLEHRGAQLVRTRVEVVG